MYQVDKTCNKLVRLDRRTFSSLGLRERDHLQEWIAKMPSILGEELLIIQKEFSDFDGTHERLDLLAVDKQGNLVLIENKLDDSGRDVVWQALKYAAYVSSLKTSQIVDIYQRYLLTHGDGGDASERLSTFLGADETAELALNIGNSQRIVLTAANFRKEVTATVLWLMRFGVQLQCIRVVPFLKDDDIFVDVQKIIPVPEAEEYMINVSMKEVEDQAAQIDEKRRHALRREFWKLALDAMRQNEITFFERSNPTQDYYINGVSGVSGCYYNLVFGKKEARVELSLQRPSAVENKRVYDRLEKDRLAINERFGDELIWRRMDDYISSRIQFSKAFNGYLKENWPEIIDWLVRHVVALDSAVRGPLHEADPRGSGPA